MRQRALELRMVEGGAEVRHRLPDRIVHEDRAAGDAAVQLGRDVARLLLHPVGIGGPGVEQAGDVRLGDIEEVDEDHRCLFSADLLKDGHGRVEWLELKHFCLRWTDDREGWSSNVAPRGVGVGHQVGAAHEARQAQVGLARHLHPPAQWAPTRQPAARLRAVALRRGGDAGPRLPHQQTRETRTVGRPAPALKRCAVFHSTP